MTGPIQLPPELTDKPDAVIVVNPGDAVIFVWPAHTTHSEADAIKARVKAELGDVPTLHVAGVDNVIRIKADPALTKRVDDIGDWLADVVEHHGLSRGL